jgi:hypothetical protein
METKTATEALKTIECMAEEMEERYEKKIELLELRVVDACGVAERYLLENSELKKQFEANTVSGKVKELELENEDLVDQVGGLIVEAREARRSFTGLQIAVSVLLFAYGMFYGTYFGKCM